MGGLRINKISKALGAFTGSSTDPLLTSNASTGKVDTTNNTFGSLPDGTFWIGDVTNTPVPHFITGDITISNAGVAAIGAGVIVNADINAAAAIGLTKLAPVAFSFALVSDGAGFITTSLTTAIQVGYLSTTTSDVQVQLNGKQATITGAASSVVVANLNPNIVPVTDGAGKFISSTTTITALSYINNLTSDAQTQIDTKLGVSLGVSALGDILYYNGSAWTNFPKGLAGQVLTTTGATIGWGAATANGLPVGGTAAQFLAKLSGVNYDVSWFTLTTSLITDILATAAQINASTNYLTLAGAPTGTNGQALTIIGGIMGWSNVGTGTVTSVGVSGGTTGLTFGGSPVTTSGTMTMSGTLGVVNGGTNQTTVAIGDILYGSGVNTWSRLAAGTNGFVLTMSAGVPVWQVAGGGGGGWSTSGATVLTANTSQSGAFSNTFNLNRVFINQNAQSAVNFIALQLFGGIHTNVPNEIHDVYFNLTRNVTYNTGALASHRAVLITSPTINFNGASTVTTAATLAIAAAPFGGTNAVITNSAAILVSSGAVGTVGNSYGVLVNAMVGATNNFAAAFLGGNVGVGTASPLQKLHVSEGQLFISNSTAESFIRSQSSTGEWQFGNNNGGNGTDGNQFYIYDRVGVAYRLTIQKGSGNVGIGTTSPTSYGAGYTTLTVAGGVESGMVDIYRNGTRMGFMGSEEATSFGLDTTTVDLSLRVNNTERLRILANGNVGIGTNNPAYKLDVAGSARSRVSFDITHVPSDGSGLHITDGTTRVIALTRDVGGFSNLYSYSHLAFFTGAGSGAERMRILDSGNVGIGTGNPQAPLHIGAPVGGNDVLFLDTPGNLGSPTMTWLQNGVVKGTFAYVNGYGMLLNLQGGNFRVDSTSPRFQIAAGGAVQINNLAGASNSPVYADTSGVLYRTTAMSFDVNNNILLTDGKNIFTGLVSGTMFGTSDLQKLSFYGQIPDRQPDTSLVSIAKLTFGGSPIGENDTIGGYTIGQVVAALKRLGLLQ